jgi:hypothetical protein
MIRSVRGYTQIRHDVGLVSWNSKDDAVTLDPRTAAVLALGEAELARVLLDLKEGEPEEYAIARRVYEAARLAAVAADAEPRNG